MPPGKVVCMHWKEVWEGKRPITDSYFKVVRRPQGMVFLVDRLDGKPVDMSFSVLSDRLRKELQPYVEDGSFRDYEWCLVKEGGEFSPPRVARRTRI